MCNISDDHVVTTVLPEQDDATSNAETMPRTLGPTDPVVSDNTVGITEPSKQDYVTSDGDTVPSLVGSTEPGINDTVSVTSVAPRVDVTQHALNTTTTVLLTDEIEQPGDERTSKSRSDRAVGVTPGLTAHPSLPDVEMQPTSQIFRSLATTTLRLSS